MTHATTSRRTLIAGMVTAIVGLASYAKAAGAFSPGTQGLVQAASRLSAPVRRQRGCRIRCRRPA